MRCMRVQERVALPWWRRDLKDSMMMKEPDPNSLRRIADIIGVLQSRREWPDLVALFEETQQRLTDYEETWHKTKGDGFDVQWFYSGLSLEEVKFHVKEARWWQHAYTVEHNKRAREGGYGGPDAIVRTLFETFQKERDSFLSKHPLPWIQYDGHIESAAKGDWVCAVIALRYDTITMSHTYFPTEIREECTPSFSRFTGFCEDLSDGQIEGFLIRVERRGKREQKPLKGDVSARVRDVANSLRQLAKDVGLGLAVGNIHSGLRARATEIHSLIAILWENVALMDYPDGGRRPRPRPPILYTDADGQVHSIGGENVRPEDIPDTEEMDCMGDLVSIMAILDRVGNGTVRESDPQSLSQLADKIDKSPELTQCRDIQPSDPLVRKEAGDTSAQGKSRDSNAKAGHKPIVGDTADDTNRKTGNGKNSFICNIDNFDNRGGSTTFGPNSPIDNSKVTNPSPKEKEPWYKIAHPIIAIIVGLIAIFGFITGIRSCRDLSDKKPPPPPTTQLDTPTVIKSPIDPNIVDINKPISRVGCAKEEFYTPYSDCWLAAGATV